MGTDALVEFSGSKRFDIQRQLGAGGMGIVYLATDRETGQSVALKTLKAVDPTAIFKFKQEFRSLSELVHPNLIRMHELICENDQWFFVMELVEGAMEFQDYLLLDNAHAAELVTEVRSSLAAPTLDRTSGGAMVTGNSPFTSATGSATSSSRQLASQSPFSPNSVGNDSGRAASALLMEFLPADDKTIAMGNGDTTHQIPLADVVELTSTSKPNMPAVDPLEHEQQPTGHWTPSDFDDDAGEATIIRPAAPHDQITEVIHRDDAVDQEAVTERDAGQSHVAATPGGAMTQTSVRPLTDAAIVQTIIGSSDLAAHATEPVETSTTTSVSTPSSESVAARGTLAVRNIPKLRAAFRQLVAGVRGLHGAGMLHRDLKPANALVSHTGTVVLLDFGLVAELSAKRVDGAEQREISGTIAYMSPEQARALPLTEASDWYAVGVMLFQALTGQLPFTGKALQILRRKTVEDAPAPADLIDNAPADLNELCVKLLRRTPDQRPTGREIAAFFGVEEAKADALPQTQAMLFVGRERHLAELKGAFQQVRSGQTVVVRVHGRSGAGKTALIQHFLDELSDRQQAIVLTGRCYEQESVPYKGVDSLIDAVTQFLRITTLPVMSLLPEGIVALARIFPVLNRIKAIEALGQTQAVTSDLRELRRQAFGALRELLSRIGREQPLVIYLDDLQWGDIDSAALLADLFSGERPPRMLLLAAYRSEYIETSVCLKTLLLSETSSTHRNPAESLPSERSDSDSEQPSDDILFSSGSFKKTSSQRSDSSSSSQFRRSEIPLSSTCWKEVIVEALTADETRRLARSLLRDDLPNVDASADQIVSQSGGSAYFVHELARHLNSGLDLSSISGVGLDDVLWAHIQRLPDEAQKLMQIVAVSGQPIPLRNVLEAADLLAVSPRVLATLRTERFLRSSGPGMQAEVEAFHDRIRESVVNRLGAEIKTAHHGRLADTLERSEDASPETIAGHLEGAGRLEKAGRFYSEAAKFALQKLAFDRAEEFSKHAVRLAKSDDDKAQAHERLIHYYTDMARFPEAYAQGREAAKYFGVSLPKGFIPPLFLIDFIKAKWRLIGRKMTDLLNLPTMADNRQAKAVRMINAAAKAAYQVQPELCVAVSTKAVNLCLKHGNTPDCAVSWMVFGAIFQGGVLGMHPIGHEFGRLALSLVDKYQQERQRPEVTFVVGYFGTSWMRPATEAEALWRTTYESGRATGDLFHTGCACAATTQSLLMRGVKLSEIWAESERFLDFLKPVQLKEPIGAIRSIRQTIRILCGKTRDTSSFSTDTFNEVEYVASLTGYGSRHFAHYYFINKMLSQYLWREYEAAWLTSQASALYLKESPGMLHSAEHHFLTGLIHAALAEQQTGSKRSGHVRGLRSAAKRLAKWAAACPHNFEHKAQLLAGELARLSGSMLAAEVAYESAIRAAETFGYQHVAAITHQRYAVLHEQTSTTEKAATERRLAKDCFAAWGASAIAKSV